MEIPHTSWATICHISPPLRWKWASEHLAGVSCVPAHACCQLHDHSAPWRRGWPHLRSKHRDTNQVHPKEDLFWWIQILCLKLELQLNIKKYFVNKCNELFGHRECLQSHKRSTAGWGQQVTCLFCVTGHYRLSISNPAGAAEGSWFSRSHSVFSSGIIFWQ